MKRAWARAVTAFRDAGEGRGADGMVAAALIEYGRLVPQGARHSGPTEPVGGALGVHRGIHGAGVEFVD
jgi:hypothetical protein